MASLAARPFCIHIMTSSLASRARDAVVWRLVCSHSDSDDNATLSNLADLPRDVPHYTPHYSAKLLELSPFLQPSMYSLYMFVASRKTPRCADIQTWRPVSSSRSRRSRRRPTQNWIRAPSGIGGSLNWEDGRSTGKVFSGLRRMSEDSGAGTQPGSCGTQEGIPGASLDSSGSGRGPVGPLCRAGRARQRPTHAGVDHLRRARWQRRPRPGRRHAVLILLLRSADARKQSRQSSCVPNPCAQQERATNVRVRRNS
eukprot:scaffold3459_cov119-Isochrysis_galbana.AAC.7